MPFEINRMAFLFAPDKSQSYQTSRNSAFSKIHFPLYPVDYEKVSHR